MRSTRPNKTSVFQRPSLTLTAFLVLAAGFLAVAAGSGSPMSGATQERVAVGDVAHDFSLETLDGSELRLSDLRAEKNAIVVFFRGAW